MNKSSIEMCLYRGLSWLVRRLPEKAACRLMGGVALFLQDVCGWRRKQTRARIRQVFPDMPDKEREGVRRQALRHLGWSVLELIRPPKDYDEQVQGMEEAFSAFRKAQERGKGVLLVIVHSGNWDLAGVRTTQEGFPISFIARKQRNEALYGELLQARKQAGGELIDRHDPRLLKKVLAALKANRIVAILVDIRAQNPVKAWRFLDQPAWLSNGLGLLAAKSGAEVVPVGLRREGMRGHVWKPFPGRHLEQGAGREERDKLLQSCLDDLGPGILAYPDSYFWFNKRWVLQPAEGQREDSSADKPSGS